MSDGNGVGAERRECTLHGEVQISFTSDKCPMCTYQRASEAIAAAAGTIGMVLVKLHIMGSPFRISMPQQFAEVGAAAAQQIQASLDRLDAAIGTGGKSTIAVARSPLVVPR